MKLKTAKRVALYLPNFKKRGRKRNWLKGKRKRYERAQERDGVLPITID